METAGSSETLETTYTTTWCHSSENHNFELLPPYELCMSYVVNITLKLKHIL
jgi:hypothetical protein